MAGAIQCSTHSEIHSSVWPPLDASSAPYKERAHLTQQQSIVLSRPTRSAKPSSELKTEPYSSIKEKSQMNPTRYRIYLLPLTYS